MITGYRIFEICDGGKIKTLFHGVNGSRTLPVGEWIHAEAKLVRDGTGKARYMSGFHFFKTYDEARESLERDFRAKRTLVVMRVQVYHRVRPKVRARRNVWLAQSMMICDHINGGGVYEPEGHPVQ